MRRKAIKYAFLAALTLLSSRAVHANKNAAAEQSDASKTAVLIGAGDVADCTLLAGAEATAKLIEQNPGTVMAIGDLAYPDGTKENFECYDKTWGRFKSRTRPAVGNHEFHSAGATFYFQYFGDAAGSSQDGFYSYELGAWHIVVLNSECKEVGGCNAGSRQEKWLRADLAAHPAACTLAYFHKPLFSSGAKHGDDPEIKPLWQALYDANADVVVNGHDHDYERFAPQDPDGKADAKRGIREFVAGTGGKNQRPFGEPRPNSEIRSIDGFGVLKLTLRAGGYDWRFIPEAGKTFTDSGSGICH
ncbi:MAG TPA: metallophosphoesterase [Candidatus Dormibacteraeota bacterium]|nr:metallophosphoesterase [Candidatus Dormibacteraeota bacterium]